MLRIKPVYEMTLSYRWMFVRNKFYLSHEELFVYKILKLYTDYTHTHIKIL